MSGNRASSAGGKGGRNLRWKKDASQREDDRLFEYDEAPKDLGFAFDGFVLEDPASRME